VLLDSLCALGFVNRSNGSYELAPLVKKVMPVLGKAPMLSQHRGNWQLWGGLADAIRRRTQAPPPDEYWSGFAESTREFSLHKGTAVVDLLKLPKNAQARVLDVGCGAGGMGFAFAVSDPTIRVTCIDTERVLKTTRGFAKSLGIADRVDFRAMDVLGDSPFGQDEFDVVIGSNLIHLFDDTDNRKLLKKVLSALVPGGRVVLCDIIPDEERRKETYAVLFAVEMYLRTPGGSTYTFGEVSSWLREIGYEKIELHPMGDYISSIVASRPASGSAKARN